jgi:alpha-beta hydrolase superfamily lysophospholipase
MSALPGPATPTKTFSFPSKTETLYAEWFAPTADARGLAVIVHGYAEHCGRYREVANVLAAGGWATLSFDVRGHGQSTGKRGHITRFTEYIDDLDAAWAAAKGAATASKLPTDRRVIVAHSNGSLITLRAMTDAFRKVDVAAAVVASPFLGLRLPVSGARKMLARVASKIAPAFAQANQLRVEDLTKDTAKQAERAADKLCHSVATARWFTEAMAAQDHVYEYAARVSKPTLWLVGGDDPIADPSRSRAVADRIGKTATYHHLAGLRHEVFNEVERGDVFATMRDYLADV